MPIVKFQKISILPQGRSRHWNFLGDWGAGSLWPKDLEKCMKPNWEFSDGWGLTKIPFCGGSMDIFRNLHISGWSEEYIIQTIFSCTSLICITLNISLSSQPICKMGCDHHDHQDYYSSLFIIKIIIHYNPSNLFARARLV